MNTRIYFYMAIALVAVVTSCTKKVSLEDQIDALEKERSAMTVKISSPEYKKITDSLYVLIDSFTSQEQSNEKSPKYLLKLAEYKNSIGDIAGGANTYKLFFTRYPQHEDAPRAMLNAGLIFEKPLNDRVHAKKLYKRVIEEYPNSNQAEIAKDALKVLDSGLSDEEYLEKILKERAENEN